MEESTDTTQIRDSLQEMLAASMMVGMSAAGSRFSGTISDDKNAPLLESINLLNDKTKAFISNADLSGLNECDVIPLYEEILNQSSAGR